MTEFKSVIVVQVDESGQPTNLLSLEDGDTISDEVLSPGVRDAASGVSGVSATVYANSGTWNEGGEPSAAGYQNWNEVSTGYSTFSGDIQACTVYVSGRWDDLDLSTRNLSGILDTSTDYPNAVADGTFDQVGRLQTTLNCNSNNITNPGTVDGVDIRVRDLFLSDLQLSTANLSGILDTSTNYPNTFADGTFDQVGRLTTTLNCNSNNITNPGTVDGVDIGVRDQFLSNLQLSTSNLSGILDASTNYPNTFADGTFDQVGRLQTTLNCNSNNITNPGTVDGVDIGTRDQFLSNLQLSTANLSGILDASTNYPNAYITANEDDITETRTVRNVSGTAFLTGNTPTLSNDLDVNSNDLNNVASVYGRPGLGGGAELFVSAANMALHAPDDIMVSAGEGSRVKVYAQQILEFSSGQGILYRDSDGTTETVTAPAVLAKESASGYDYSLSAWETVRDNSGTWGTGGGGSYEGSAVASAIAVGNGSSVIVSGADTPGTPIEVPKNGMILALNTVDGRAYWKRNIFSSPIDEVTSVDTIELAEGVESTAQFNLQGVQMNLTNGGLFTLNGSVAARRLDAGALGVSATGPIKGYNTDTSFSGAGDLKLDGSGEISGLPYPAPVSYAQMDGDGTAAQTETNFGAGVTPTTINDPYGQITWNNTDKDWDINADGTYEVYANLVFNVATTTLVTIKIKNGSTAKNTYVNQGIHSAEDPEHVGIQAVFTCSSGDTISVTFDDDGTTDVNLMAGSAVTIRRIY